jgi:hypothetical protein
MWPFKLKRKHSSPLTNNCFAVGSYVLDQTPQEFTLLRFFSDAELALLDRDVVFVGERVAHAPSVNFEGLEWDVVLGLVGDIVYKISVQWTGPRAEAGRVARTLMIRCTTDYGSANSISGAQLWDARNGNIILQSQNFGGEAILVLSITSNAVATFQTEKSSALSTR